MLSVKVNKNDPTDLYEQVAAEIRRAIADGEARPGERLPPAKDLAASPRCQRPSRWGRTACAGYRLIGEVVGGGAIAAPDQLVSRVMLGRTRPGCRFRAKRSCRRAAC
jgi:hypothetical protein